MNATVVDTDLCTVQTCSVEIYGQLHYIPSFSANVAFLAIFAAALVAQVLLGIRYKTWGFLGSMIGGTALEVVGYTGRLLLKDNVFDQDNFVIYLVGLTIGPAFFSAAIYLCLARIISIYGHGLTYFKPRTITIFFICCDLVSLILQAAGGALASLADTKADSDMGVHIMVAGLAAQVAATSAFCVICIHLMWNISKRPELVNQDNKDMRRQPLFRFFLIAIGVATGAILIRCSFRVAELSEGFNGKLANDEVLFMILDGAMMIICVVCLTFAHPGLVLGPMWALGGFKLRSGKKNGGDYGMTETNKLSTSSESSLSGSRRGNMA